MIQEKIYKYFDGNPSLHVLFVFDAMNQILPEIESLTWREGYRLEVFAGNWFTVKYSITHDWKDGKVILVFQDRQGVPTSGDGASFPLYGEMKANMVYSDVSYVTFMQLKGISSEFAGYISKHVNELQLAKYDRILADHYKPGVFSTDLCNRGLLSGYMGANRLLSWEEIIIRMVCLCDPEADSGKKDSFFRALAGNRDASDALSSRMVSIAGQPFEPMTTARIRKFAESFKYNAITQNIPVVPADDYRSYKTDDAIRLQRINSLLEIAVSHPTLSEPFRLSLARLAKAVDEDRIIACYGTDAEYSCVTEALGYHILKALAGTKAFTSPVETNERLRSMSLRLPAGSGIQQVFDFMSDACLMLEKMQALGTFKLKTPMEYIFKYQSEFHLVDMHYRHLTASFRSVDPSLPIYDSLLAFKNRLDEEYAKQCNIFNLEWLRCVYDCGEVIDGMAGILHQDEFYDGFLKGVTSKRAVIVSDALRYEVATEILSGLGDAKHEATLKPALSTIPSETKYCKSMLLPHSSLQYADCQLIVDGQCLDTMDKRTEQVHKYEPGAVCISMSDLDKYSMEQKREIFKSPLVYIFHDTIDSVSHDNPSMTATACSQAIAEIRRLIPSLHSSYNVTNVYVTSDHGFLYNDMAFEEKDKIRNTDTCEERKTRYYITADGSPVTGIAKLRMDSASPMKGNGLYVAVPEGTNRLYAEGGGYQFAHGGAALQEIIIPVLHSHYRKENSKQKVGASLLSSVLSMVSSRLRFDIVQSEAINEDMRERTIACGLYDGDELLSQEKTITLDSADANPRNRITSIELTLTKTAPAILELRIFDTEDRLNTLAKATVTNKTLIEKDF